MKTITKQNIFGGTSLLLLLLLLVTNSLRAQPGTNDPAFNIPDQGVNSILKGADNAIKLAAMQLNNNKIIIAGDFTHYNGVPANRIARLSINGNIDDGFNTGTGLTGTPKALVVQTDYKVIVGGNLSTYNGQSINHIIRLNSNGKIDNTFKTGTGFNGPVTCVALQADGKILVGGNFTAFNGSSINNIARLHKNGSLDNSFNTAASYAPVLKIGVQADGKIMIAYGKTFLKRLNQNGAVDASFDYIPFPRHDERDLETMVIQQDGKILIAGGSAPDINGIRGFLHRYTSSGQIDSTFNYADTDREWIYSLALQADGKIILSGTQGVIPDDYVARNCVKRLFADGKTDSTFFEVNKVTERRSVTYTVNIQPDGKIIAGGFFQNINTYEANNLIRLNNDGTPDITFNKTTGANGSIRASAVQKNGRIIIGGNFYTYQYKSRNHIARLTKDGKLDNSFDPGTGTNGSVYAIAIQTDKKILIGGNFTAYNGTPVNNMARINADGSLDTDFHIGSGVNGVVNVIKIQPDGKILLAGEFRKINGVNCNMLARLNTDGTTDNTFLAPNILDGHYSTSINEILLLPSNNIIIGGNFLYAVNGKYFTGIVKLNTNGVIDTSFERMERSEIVNACALQPDGKIIIGGGRRETETQYYGFLLRINANGSVDTTFKRTETALLHYPCYVQSLSLLESNKVLVGGRFIDFDNKPANYSMLVNDNGEPDSAFVGDANGYVWTTQALTDDKALVAGGFTKYNGVNRNRITRILLSQPYNARKATETINNKTVPNMDELNVSIYPNPASAVIVIDGMNTKGDLKIINAMGETVYATTVARNKEEIDLSTFANGIYFIKYDDGKIQLSRKIIVNK